MIYLNPALKLEHFCTLYQGHNPARAVFLVARTEVERKKQWATDRFEPVIGDLMRTLGLPITSNYANVLLKSLSIDY